jgi:hypothetical protein
VSQSTKRPIVRPDVLNRLKLGEAALGMTIEAEAERHP